MPIDVSKLQVSLEEGERWRRTLRITVPSELVQAERQAAVRQLSSRLRLPGFRAGKIPAAVVEKRFGAALEQELLDRVIGEAYRGVLADRSLRPISEGEVADIEYAPDSDLRFGISFDVAPEVEFGRLGGFKVERPPVGIGDEEVDKVLDRLREQEGTWVPIEEGTPGETEKVAVRIERLEEEEEAEPRRYEFVLGREEALPEIEEAIRSLAVGESGEFSIQLPPEETEGEDPPEGATQRLRIHLDGRKELELPALDDELARTLGDFDSLEALKARIREDLEKEALQESEAVVRGLLVEQILAANPFEVPESMVDQYVRSALGDPEELSEEQWAEARKQLGPRAIHGVKRYMVLTRVAEAHGLDATPEELDERIEEIAERSGSSPTDVYSRLQRSGRLEQLEREITEQKVFTFLMEQSEITEPAA